MAFVVDRRPRGWVSNALGVGADDPGFYKRHWAYIEAAGRGDCGLSALAGRLAIKWARGFRAFVLHMPGSAVEGSARWSHAFWGGLSAQDQDFWADIPGWLRGEGGVLLDIGVGHYVPADFSYGVDASGGELLDVRDSRHAEWLTGAWSVPLGLWVPHTVWLFDGETGLGGSGAGGLTDARFESLVGLRGVFPFRVGCSPVPLAVGGGGLDQARMGAAPYVVPLPVLRAWVTGDPGVPITVPASGWSIDPGATEARVLVVPPWNTVPAEVSVLVGMGWVIDSLDGVPADVDAVILSAQP